MSITDHAENATVEDLRPVDAFHIGGRIASAHVLIQQSSAEKIPDMVANLAANRIGPVEMIAVKSV